MSREKYTHVQALFPEIRAMEASGKRNVTEPTDTAACGSGCTQRRRYTETQKQSCEL